MQSTFQISEDLTPLVNERARAADLNGSARNPKSWAAEALNALGVGLFICDGKAADCPLRYVSTGFTVITLYTAAEAFGRGIFFLFGPATEISLGAAIGEALAERKRFRTELICYRRDLTPFWCELTLAPLVGGASSDHLIVGQIADITARKEEEIQTRTSEAKFRGMFENCVEGVYQSTPNGAYLAVNPALVRMYGYGNAQELLESVSDIEKQIYVDPAFREQFRREIDQCGLVRDLTYQVRRRDGSTFWISECARAVRDPAGKVQYYEGFISDVSLRKEAESARARMEKQMVEAQKMEAIATLAGGIAHDFNNLLCVMLGCTELALNDKLVVGAARRNLEAVLKSAHRAKDLVRQILAISRRSEPQRGPVKFTPILKECVKLLQATVPSSVKVHLECRTEQDVVEADPTEIHQVLMNLGTNAVHAMRGKGGELSWSLEPVAVDAPSGAALELSPGPHLCLTVRDTGHGMEPEVMSRIFDPLFTTKPIGEGTGLGLSVVKSIVRGCHGRVTVESQVDIGTVFRIYLPHSSEAPTQAGGPQAPLHSGHRERLLVVDDDVTILMMMQQRLRRMGYRVITRADSLAALEAVRSSPNHYDLVLTDHTMPDLQGVGLAAEIAKIRPDLPLILMTGLNQEPASALFAPGTRRAVVRKPLDFIELSSRLRGLLESK